MKAWRDSASLILAARQGRKLNKTASDSTFQYDYKLLKLKRNANTSFLPGKYVFPGGTTEPSDGDLKWNRLFSGLGVDTNNFATLIPKSTTRPLIFKPRRNELPREVSLRITAIRETFEESGILVCRKVPVKGTITEWAEHITVDDIKKWQSRVHDDATEFFRMCESLGCYPDIWALHEWSNWLTPTFLPKRFDTIFYMACMPSQPDAHCEEKEIEELMWADPQTILDPANGIELAPPQQYEIARMAKFECLDNLLDFAIAHSKKGVQVIMPIKVKLADGWATVCPGDSMYPEEISFTEKQVLDRRHMTLLEFREASAVKNRMEFFSLDVMALTVDNFPVTVDGHLPPFPTESVQVKSAK